MEEQRAIRDRIRDEERARRDQEREIKKAAEEARKIEAERERVMREMAVANEADKAKFETMLAEMAERLRLAEERGQRAKSMAELTKKGTVYIISNIGAFGERVFKIGQTRRLDPMDRIWELGDASVPFDFDVHALIQSDDAPKLEGLLHQEFVLAQVNKMNWRKEFFRADLTDIRRAVETLGLEAEWTMTAAAQQFRETQALEAQLEADPEFRERWIVEQRGMEFEMQRASIGSGEAEDEDESV
jgi:hypothetical protein